MKVQNIIPKNIDLSKYVGEWIVIDNNRVIAHDSDLATLQTDINRCKRTPTLMKVPKDDILIFQHVNSI